MSFVTAWTKIALGFTSITPGPACTGPCGARDEERADAIFGIALHVVRKIEVTKKLRARHRAIRLRIEMREERGLHARHRHELVVEIFFHVEVRIAHRRIDEAIDLMATADRDRHDLLVL
jgi:hypothetical protein